MKFFLLFGLVLLPIFANADGDLSLLKQKAQCLIETHHITKVTWRQHFYESTYSMYPHVSGSEDPDGFEGGIFYTTDKLYFLDLRPAIETLRNSKPNGTCPNCFGGWIKLKTQTDIIYVQYDAHFSKNFSPLSITGTPMNEPEVAPIVDFKEVLDSDKELIQKLNGPFDEALKTAKQGTLEKLKQMNSKDKKAALMKLKICDGIIDFIKF